MVKSAGETVHMPHYRTFKILLFESSHRTEINAHNYINTKSN